MMPSHTIPDHITEYDFTIALFRNPDWLLKFLDAGLHESDFEDELARALIKAARHRYKGNYPLSIQNMVQQLERQHESNDAICMFVLRVQEVKDVSADEAYMLYTCFNNWQRQKAIALLEKTQASIACADTEVDSLVTKAITDLYQLRSGDKHSTVSSMSSLRLLLKELSGKQEQPIHPTISTGFAALDTCTTGLQSGSIWIVAAKPDIGSTAFALNMVRNVLATENPVLVVSTSHNRQHITGGLLAMESGLAFEKVVNKNITTNEAGRLYHCSETMALNKCHICDDFFDTADELLTYLHKTVPRLRSRLILIDGWDWNYPQVPEEAVKANRNLLRKLKNLAMRFGVSIVLTATIFIGRYWKEILDESGDPIDEPPLFRVGRLRDLVANHLSPGLADVVLTIYRPEYYVINATDDLDANEAMVRILRNQHGPLNTIHFKTEHLSGRWSEWTRQDEFNPEEMDDEPF